MDKVFLEDSSMRTMERFLDLAVQRQALISSNVVNIDTPGYKTVDIRFEDEMKNIVELERQRDRIGGAGQTAAGAGVKAAVEEVHGLTMRNDLNNVNIDREMAQLSTNALRFSLVAQLLVGKFRTLKAAIQEGRQ